MKVAYLGPLRDYSGYGEANRHIVAALDKAGVYVIPKLVNYVSEQSDFGSLGELIEPLFKRSNEKDYKIKILHTTPNVFSRYVEAGKYNIGHFFWETDRVPDEFAEGLQLCDEIWTGSMANKKAIQAAGVTRPIEIFPQPIETDRVWPTKPYNIEFDGYLFYSIFEWTDRKNPEGLLEAFWREFEGREDVGLLIKTYFHGFSGQSRRMIREQVQLIKKRLGLSHYAPVFLYLDLMDRDQVMRLHVTGDAYVSAHRGEGWGVPQVEAALSAHPVISTAYGGCHEYYDEMLLVPFTFTKVRGMHHSSWYNSDQNWADPDLEYLRRSMRWCVEHKEEAVELGKYAKKATVDKFNLRTVGELMRARLEKIEEGLK